MQSSTNQNASTSSSPWEEELDLPETAPKSQPKVIGSLDPKGNDVESEQPVPFNVPENIEEKVGQKVPAGNYISPKEPVPPSPATANPTSPAVSPANVPNGGAAAKTIVNETPGTSLPQANNQIKPKKSVFSSLFGRMAKRKTEEIQKEAPSVSSTSSSPSPNSIFANKGLLPERPKFDVEPAKDLTPATNKSFLGRRLVPVFGILVFFAFLVALTELGLLSVGVEKIYGAIGVEKIWGGLGVNSEPSFARSAAEMKKHQNFKIKGNITMSVDSSIKSPVTSPLLVAIAQQVRFTKKDQDASESVNALKTATNSNDVYNLYDSTGSGSSNSSATSDSSAATDSSSASSASSSTSDGSATTDSSNSISPESTSDSSLSSDASNIQEVKASFETQSNKDSIGTSLDVNGASGSSKIDLWLQGGNLLVKSDAFKFSDNAESNKWLSFSIGKLEGKSLQSDFFAIDTQSGISIKGKRSSNEKVGSVRCYRYKIDSMEIGNALSGIGITSDMVQNISGDVWIGINDKLIRRADLKIITPISSAVSSFDISLEFSDFDIENKISVPEDSEVVKASGTSSTELSSNDTTRKDDVTKLLAALKKYKNDNGSYPVSNSLLKLNTADNIIEKALVPTYLSALPSDPKDGWYYAYKSDGKKCSISARLENTSDSLGQTISGVFLYLKYNND